MASPYQRKITISAGEECTISGTCTVELQLQSGVVEVAGVLLNARKPCVFRLVSDQLCVVLYTLEGGSVLASADAPFEASKKATGIAAVVQLCRRTLAAQKRSKVLVIGHSHSGKTLTAHTICNLLLENATGEAGGPAAAVFLTDLNTESNALYAPGCITAVEVKHRLWPGTSAAPTLLPFSLYVGEAALPSSETIKSFLHFVEQLHDCAEALIGEANADHAHLIIDAPAPVTGIREGVYFRRLIELLRPTHVVIVGAQDGSETWSTFLQEDVQRVLPECEFSYNSPVERRCSVSLRELRLCEYFAGTPQQPLDCAKMVLPLAQLQFVQYVEQDENVSAIRVQPTKALVNCVCALSHAELIEEVPLAPVAGLLFVVAVEEEYEELVAILPSCDDLPRRFVIVPSAIATTNEGTAASTLNASSIKAQIEEAVSV